MNGGLEQIIIGIADAVPAFRILLQDFAILVGIAYLVQGCLDLVNKSKGRQASTQDRGLGVLTKIVVGAVLISFGFTVENIVNTISGNYIEFAVLNNQQVTGYSKYNEVLTALLRIVQAIGLTGILRGLMICKAASSGQQQAGYGKAAIFIIGGGIAVNMLGAIKMFETTAHFSIGSLF